jgi:uncharacterized membrane protein required for colicin V production
MMSLSFAFVIFLLLFALIGAMRGWAKELLVTFSVVLCMFLLEVVNRYFPAPVRGFFDQPNTSTEFWVRAFLLVSLAFFGYQTPNIPKLSGGKFARDKFADSLLGFFIGMVNGFFIVGSLWFYLADSGYPFKNVITRPDPTPAIMAMLAPVWLKTPTIFFVMALAFLFVLIVFI